MRMGEQTVIDWYRYNLQLRTIQCSVNSGGNYDCDIDGGNNACFL